MWWGGEGVRVWGGVKLKKKFWGGGVMSGGSVGLGGVRVDVNEDLKFYKKIHTKQWGEWSGGGVGLGGQGECERQIEVFGKIHKKKSGEGGGRVFGFGGQGECKRRIEVFVKIQKKI